MRFDIVTLFPELFTPFMSLGVTRRAYELGLMSLNFWNPRDYATGVYRRVDDRPFGGGPGMVMMAAAAGMVPPSPAPLTPKGFK